MTTTSRRAPQRRTLSDADVEAIANLVVPKIEAKLAERFYSTAGRGLLGWFVKLWQPILIALILYGLTIAPNLPKTIADALHASGK